MKRLNESIRVTPLVIGFSTADSSAISGKTQINGAGDFAVLCQVKCGTVATGLSATAANNFDFAVTESTAATVAGSAITGATLTLGAATAAKVVGAVNGLLKVTSDVSSAVQVTINGIVYRTTAAGATASNGAKKLASAINGNGTSARLPHYTAIAEHNNTGVILITPSDDLGTGLTFETTAAAATIAPYMINLQGVIDIAQCKLSTNSPKYIGVTCTPLTGGATSIIAASLLTSPTASPTMPGKIVTVAT